MCPSSAITNNSYLNRCYKTHIHTALHYHLCMSKQSADLTVECDECNLLRWVIPEEGCKLMVNSCLDTLQLKKSGRIVNDVM